MARRSRRTVSEEEYLPPENEEEDFEEEAPRRRRRPARDEEEDEDDAPPRRRRPSRDADEEEPRRRRRAARDEDEDDDDEDEEDESPRRKPRGSKGKSSRSRRPAEDDEDEDDAPRRRKASSTGAGWGGYKKTKENTSSFAKKWKPPLGDEVLIKFLADEPFGSYGMHWFDELGKGQKKGWMCLMPIEDRCPACDIGDRPKGKALFSVVVFDDDGVPSVEVLEAGTWLANQLETLAEGKNGPLSKHYWALSSSGGKGQGPVNYSLSVVKERDEEEWDAWGFDPLEEDELEEFAAVKHELGDVEKIPSYKAMREVVKSLDD